MRACSIRLTTSRAFAGRVRLTRRLSQPHVGGDAGGRAEKGGCRGDRKSREERRGWYGGAVGLLSLSGDINTGILIRTTYLRDGYATYPAGATLLYDSDPEAIRKNGKHG